MELCRWFVRGLGVACLALGGISLGVVSLAASPAYAQTVSSIAVQGNQRVEADTIRSYFRAGPNGQLDPFQIDEGVKALFATGLFQDVRPTMQGGRLTITVIENPVINRIAFEGNKKIKDEQIKTEIQSKERGTLSRPVVQADTARLVEVYRRSGRFDIRVEPEDYRASQQPRRSRLRNHRGREDRGQANRVHRQSRVFVLTAQGRHQDLHDRSSRLPPDQRRLRSGPGRGRSRVAAPVLPQARLYRRARRVRRRGVRSELCAGS